MLTKENGYLTPSAVFVDGTHIKANADNREKYEEITVRNSVDLL